MQFGYSLSRVRHLGLRIGKRVLDATSKPRGTCEHCAFLRDKSIVQPRFFTVHSVELCRNGHLKIVESLLQARAKLNATDRYSQTPLAGVS